MYPKFIPAALLILGFASAAYADSADTWKIDPAHTDAEFSVRHMMVSNVRGQFSKISGSVHYDGHSLSKADCEATIDASTVDTREPKRDTHLKSPDFFDVAKYPTITFKSREIKAPSPDGNFQVIGDLTMHGVTRPVTLNVEQLSPEIKDPHGGVRIGATATAKVNRKDFGMQFNGLLDNGGAVVGDDVNITLDVELVKRPEPKVSLSK